MVVARRSDLVTALDRPFVRPTTTSGSGVGLYVCGRLLAPDEGADLACSAGKPSGFAVSIELPEAV